MNRSTLGVGMAAVALAGLLGVIGCEDDDDNDNTTVTTTTVAGATTTTQPAAAALKAPVLVSPADDVTYSHFPRTVVLAWQDVAGAEKYKVEVQYRTGGDWVTQFTADSTDTSHTFNFIGAQPGRWRVWAVDEDDDAGPKSEYREFDFTV